MAVPDSVQPNVTWVQVPAIDLFSALRSLPTSNQGEWCIRETPGESVETYLAWARAALEDADTATDLNKCKRHSVEAVGHAKRALDRLMDLYLRRDWLQMRL